MGHAGPGPLEPTRGVRVHGLSTIAVIPARGGSKGVPRKNLRPLRGRSLVARAVEIGLATCSAVVVSSDDARINREAVEAGAGFVLRPAELATDEAPMLPVVQHAIRGLKGDVVVLLQPTQPLRTAAHVLAALSLLAETDAASVVSVVEVPQHFSPDYVLDLGGMGEAWPWDDPGGDLDRMATRRQTARRSYSRDGTVYVVRREVVEAGSLYGRDCRALVIQPGESVNIDDEDDWRRAESMVTS